MSRCLVCLRNPIPGYHIMCRSCYQSFDEMIREVQAKPYSAEELRKKLWGQQFEKNRTPANRARIAYAAYVLASEGDDEMLLEVRRAFEAPAAPSSPASDVPKLEPLASEARAVSDLDKLLGHRSSATDTAGGIRTKDGHWVRSKSEQYIANFLFDNRIWYQYERPVTIGGIELRPDFYLPDVGRGIYIEHFGILDDPRYRQLADRKIALYTQAKLNVIVTDEKDALDMDAALRRKLGHYVPSLHVR